MKRLDEIADQISVFLEAKNAARDHALQHSRTLIRHCSKAIRAIHRRERELALEHLDEARKLVLTLRDELSDFPDLFYAGYTQDACKEFAEASIVFAIIEGQTLPSPDELQIENAAYLGGLGEAAGEMRRKIVDILRHDEMDEAEVYFQAMEDIYAVLVTMDYPDAITKGLRRITDMVRGVTERTRGDITTSIQQRDLKAALLAVEQKLDHS
jgi:translin